MAKITKALLEQVVALGYSEEEAKAFTKEQADQIIDDAANENGGAKTPTPPTPPAPKEVVAKVLERTVVGLKDHRCKVGHNVVTVQKNKETTIPEDAAKVLQNAGIVIFK